MGEDEDDGMERGGGEAVVLRIIFLILQTLRIP